METEILVKTQRLPGSLRKIFPFFEKPENLALITPDYLQFRLLTPSPVCMKKGTLIDYTISLHRIPIRWKTLITEYQPPFRFVDKQLKGPYAFWEHTHEFGEKDGHTLIKDTVMYALPAFLPAGISRTVHKNYVRPKLNDIFDYRRSIFSLMFGKA